MNDRVQRSGSPVTHAPISRGSFFCGNSPEAVNLTIPMTSAFRTSARVRTTHTLSENPVSNSGQTENAPRRR